MRDWCRRVADHPTFHKLVMLVIVLNAAVLGLETSKTLHGNYLLVFQITHIVIQVVFVVELAIRFAAAGSFRAFLSDGWNVFDTLVVLAGMLPATGAAATVARLARVLRIVRLVEVSAEMKLIVATIVSSMRSLTKLILLILVLLYSYAIIGYHLFGVKDSETDPEPDKNYATLGTSMWTLFQTMTLEGWADKQAETFDKKPHETWIFYSTFLLFATYFVLNLFVAIVVNNLQELKEAEQREADKLHSQADLLAELNALQDRLKAFEDRVRTSGGPTAG